MSVHQSEVGARFKLTAVARDAARTRGRAGSPCSHILKIRRARIVFARLKLPPTRGRRSLRARDCPTITDLAIYASIHVDSKSSRGDSFAKLSTLGACGIRHTDPHHGKSGVDLIRSEKCRRARASIEISRFRDTFFELTGSLEIITQLVDTDVQGTACNDLTEPSDKPRGVINIEGCDNRSDRLPNSALTPSPPPVSLPSAPVCFPRARQSPPQNSVPRRRVPVHDTRDSITDRAHIQHGPLQTFPCQE